MPQIVCPGGAEDLAAALDAWSSVRRLFSLRRWVILGAGMPFKSIRTGSRVTVLCSSDRSSQIATVPVRWQNNLR